MRGSARQVLKPSEGVAKQALFPRGLCATDERHAKVNSYAEGGAPRPGKPWRPEKAARLAVRLDERYQYTLWALACVCLWLRRHDEAVRTVEKMVAFNPSFSDGENALGFILRYAGRSEEL